MTFGPYCPAEAPLSLMEDARAGLADLGHATQRDEPLPFPFADIRIVPSGAVPALAEWTRQLLAAAWDACKLPVDQSPGPSKAEPAPRRRAKQAPGADPYQATAIVLALSAGNQAQARALLKGALSETESGKQVRLAVRRARAVAVTGASLEAGERAGLGMGRCWSQFPSFLERVCQARTDAELSAAAMRLLGLIKPRARRRPEDSTALGKLNAIVTARLVEGVTLNEVANVLGESPTAITHRLQRKFGMSFSQYVGRLRTDKAKELLRRTKLDVCEVARRVGINDGSNLGKLFRKFEGLSPTAYRAKFRSKQ
jgi:AraC-like DNA-binding protein